MRKITPILTIWGAVLLPLLFAAPAAAQATRTWVSGVGDDANPCSRTAPCKTFPGAISKTGAGGEIDVLDPGGFGAVTVTKAITIASEGAGEGGIVVAGTNGITVNAGSTDVVILRGLQIDGGPIGSNSLSGVRFIAGGTLIIQNCAIRNFTGGSPNGYGILFTPSGASSLFVSDTVVASNGTSTTGGGIFIQPSAGGSALASIVRVNAINNALGIRADGTFSTSPISVSISESTAAENIFAGMTAFTPPNGAVVTMHIDRSVSANNGIGLKADGATATLRVGSSFVTGNVMGIAMYNGSTMTSMGNNLIVDNATAGATMPIVGPL
jgi:hypothetical protein